MEIVAGHRVDSLADVPVARAYLLDVTPRQALAIAGDRLGGRYRRQLEGFRYGPGVFKVDWALEGPIPWADPATARAATVHLGGTLGEVVASEAAVGRGRVEQYVAVLLLPRSVAPCWRTDASWPSTEERKDQRAPGDGDPSEATSQVEGRVSCGWQPTPRRSW